MSRTISRRNFLRAGATAVAVATVAKTSRALGANNRIRIGVIGCGGRGHSHVRYFNQQQANAHKDAEAVALCDVDPARLKATSADLPAGVKQFKDFRALLDEKDIDAVYIATPCHWHAIPALQAMKAGKDVYLEKPLGHTIHEGRVLVDMAKETGRIVQIGLQQRSTQHWQDAVSRVREGELGQITTVNVWNVWNRDEMGGKLGNPPDGDPPPGVDYDMWLGPAPKRPFNPARFHFGFYFFFEYSSGMICAWGVHLFDIVNWACGYNVKSAATSGGIYVLKDARNTPDTASAVFDCGTYVMTYELRHTNGWQPFAMKCGDMDHGIEFVGTKGLLHINRSGFELFRIEDRNTRKPYYTQQASGDDTRQHHRNFFDCIRSRKPTAVPAETGHHAAVVGYLANISYRVGHSVRWDAQAETISGDPEAARLLSKDYRAPWHV